MTPGANWSDRRSARVESDVASADVNGRSAGSRAPETMTSAFATTPPAAAEGRTPRVSRVRLARLRDELSERDRAVLASLADFRFLTTSQLQLLHFSQHATAPAAGRICRRVLGRLADWRLIEHLERRIGGLRAGSASYVWRLGPMGDRLRQLASGNARGRRKEPSLHHLEHSLAIADCHVALAQAARAGQLELLLTTPEPGCWRTYHGRGGARETLKPDLYTVTATGDYEDHWFIEVDRATESLPTLLRKCAQYERYRRTGQAQIDGGVFPRVLWVMPNDDRCARLANALHQTHDVEPDLFRTTTPRGFIEAIIGGAS